MLSAADNERLTLVGPDTPMGKTLLQYWIPVCCSAQLTEPDGPPIRIRVLGKNYVVFRDTQGIVGVLDDLCPHRGASLTYGRNEEGGLRCLWHGWKFAADGRLLEASNMPDGRFKETFRANAYPVEEGGGLIWVYFGPRDNPPPRPVYVWETLPDTHVCIVPIELECNWVQAIENLFDSSHASVLHTDFANIMEQGNWLASGAAALNSDKLPTVEVERTDFGMHYAAIRSQGDSKRYVRVTTFAAPFVGFVPNGGNGFIGVPMDDTHCRFYTLIWDTESELVDGRGEKIMASIGLNEEAVRERGLQPMQPPCTGVIPPRNVFPQDRVGMGAKTTWSGLGNLTAEDAAMVTSSPIYDRSLEHLVPADHAVVTVRRILLDCVKRTEQGESPVGINSKTPSVKITARDAVLAADEDWRTLVPQHVVEPAND